MACKQGEGQSLLTISQEGRVRVGDQRGSATIIVEEGVHLDKLRTAYYVEVASIHSLILEHGTQLVTMPLGSDVELKVVLQDKHGRSFAHSKKLPNRLELEGVGISVELSHPRVLQADLDYYNSTLTVRALSLGVCNIHIYMTDQQYVFDLIKVHVTSIVDPPSPVFVHLGGSVQFRVGGNFSGVRKAVWASDDPHIVE